MFFSHSTLPGVNYIWVGPPVHSQDAAGHDIAGPIEMARLNKSNPITFWCLDEHEEYYKKVFSDQKVPIEVKTIQSFLFEYFDDPEINKFAAKLEYIGEKISLWKISKDDKEDKVSEIIQRDYKRDCISFKDLFCLFLLATVGGYTLDTNVKPSTDSFSGLPFFSKFMMPQLPEQIECWMLYAPKDNKIANGIARKILSYYLNHWDTVEKIFEEEGATSRYHIEMSNLIMESLSMYAGECSSWLTEEVSTSLYKIPALGLEKRHYSSHAFDRESKLGPLYDAIDENDINRLKELIQYGANVNHNALVSIGNFQNMTPLNYAILRGNIECVKILLKNKADPDQSITCNNALVTPLNIAESNQAFGIVALLSQAKMEKLINQSVEKIGPDNPLKRQRK